MLDGWNDARSMAIKVCWSKGVIGVCRMPGVVVVARVCRQANVWGVSPLGGGRAVALRVEPQSKAQRLAPDGRPSLTQHGQAGDAGGDDDSGPFPCPGITGLGSFTLRVNDARLTN